ncbi:Protein NAR1 [Frankliniella fusca]|uniref:Protein NAR1 n=1 Tax=Frankliniella fusca TaxID=407009 RepID=A0AAE1HAM3_9NEOP|nr:Protein NAR1 [Frankliniella fusca]KAK3916920.1 Protein NAR1 [Frankliniella fusca]KAK3929492.1 Protein NAR1 [Frankliniella fusca]
MEMFLTTTAKNTQKKCSHLLRMEASVQTWFTFSADPYKSCEAERQFKENGFGYSKQPSSLTPKKHHPHRYFCQTVFVMIKIIVWKIL